MNSDLDSVPDRGRVAVVDAQLHEPGPLLPRPEKEDVRYALFTEMTLGAMEAVGVDAAVLNPLDAAWATFTCNEFPRTFAWVAPLALKPRPGAVSVLSPDVATSMSRLSDQPGLAAFRILPGSPTLGASPAPGMSGFAALREGLYDRALSAAEELGLPVFAFTTGDISSVAVIAERFPEVPFIIDHLGMPQPPALPPDSPPFAALEPLVRLAVHPNVYVKVSGLPGLSREPYPHADIAPVVQRLLGEFGARRMMWASDITRVNGRIGFDFRYDGPYEGQHTYADSVRYLRDLEVLRPDEARWVFAETVRSLLRRPLDRVDDRLPGVPQAMRAPVQPTRALRGIRSAPPDAPSASQHQ
jgi:L-fuconolactonase